MLNLKDLRIGQGFDVHRFKEGRDMYICGVKIDYKLGLDGHSDADVGIHAIMDAILGAAGLRDIGYYFPDTDEKYKGIDSKKLLSNVLNLIEKDGWKILNIDITIIAQKPKLSPYIEKMKIVLSDILKLDRDRISIKATTTEKLGFTGREEGIAALAVVLLYK